jgi:hypothetical protein
MIFLEKIKQQLFDNFVLCVLLCFAAFGSYRSTHVRVELNDTIELKERIFELENRCAELERMREDMDDLRFAFAKAVASRPSRTTAKK